eukprot:CAMPEP_0206458944 /NCGR_PEP_ID=MMETSP0324_2-20121206/23877_1 /ASSEMBLY_ACC=CAM_ASM_000836 /TAXON_ID=2866 /ORGANISM="Crypthecodinium cohnii, Strain Seligo" /LENGTH=107 /DNA_ID=CAMNT_0053930391 /DNA_START=98 /DNA_END=422 /DNA_ORIENTATION=+
MLAMRLMKGDGKRVEVSAARRTESNRVGPNRRPGGFGRSGESQPRDGSITQVYHRPCSKANQAKMGGSDEAGKQRKWAQRRCPGPVIDIVEKRLEKDRWRHHDGIAA